MPDITIDDLIAWEPRLQPLPPPTPGVANSVDHPLPAHQSEITWSVAARSFPPILPPLRGGEIVLVSRHTLTENHIDFATLLREVALHRVAAVAADRSLLPLIANLDHLAVPVLLIREELTLPEFESELNRLLTWRRGELYRTGTELGRLLSELTANGVAPDQILTAAASTLDVPIAMLDRRGEVVFASSPAGTELISPTSSGHLYSRRLAWGESLRLGPVARDRAALIRVVMDQIANATEAALTRVDRHRPRGVARADALTSFLIGDEKSPHEHGSPHSALGLPAGSNFSVALAHPAIDDLSFHRSLTRLGVVHLAGQIDGLRAAVIEVVVGHEAPSTNQVAIFERFARQHLPPTAWLAISNPTVGPTNLPSVTRQVRYVAALRAAEAITGDILWCDRIDQLGVYHLLYPLWSAPEPRAFAAAVLGDLPGQDKHGELRRTLFAFLESGGSQVEAANRLGIHRNTLAYRLRRIAQLTGTDPVDPGQRLLLHLGLLAAALPPAP